MSAVRGVLAAVLLVGALGVNGVLAGRVKPEVEAQSSGMSVAQQERIEKMASASLFGQFRSSMADFLWLKVDKYLHNGVDLRGTTKLEKEAGNADKVGSKDKAWKHRGDETTVVPSASRDWRGVIGNIERQVNPYEDMASHGHRDAKETLPLFRLMTWSNPHFIAGYTVGASMIARDPKKLDEAITFLKEGVRQNPESHELEAELGQYLTARKKQYAEALPHLIHAIQLAAARDRKTFTEDEDEACQNAFRWLVLNRREAGDIAAAQRAAQLGLTVYPDDVVCRRFLRDHPVRR